MADSLSTALRVLRRDGLAAFSAATGRRILGLAVDYVRLRRAAPDLRVEELVALVCGPRIRPGAVVFAMQRPGEVTAFLREVRALAPRTVLEIGTASGGMLFLLARCAAPDASIISVDLPRGPFGGGYAKLRRPLYSSFATGAQRITLIRGDSHRWETLERVERVLEGRPLDLLFVDGDHTYEGVRADLAMYGPLLGEGGLLALHDICHDPAQPEAAVDPVWHLLAGHAGSKEFVEDAGQRGYGIGMTTKGALAMLT